MSVIPHAALDRAAFQTALEAADAERVAKRSRLEALGAARRVIVYTYGGKGKDLALQLRALGIDCQIYDNSPRSIAVAEADGFVATRDLAQDMPLIIGAGQNQLEIAATLDRDAYGLAEALYAYDLRSSYGSTRGFSHDVLQRADAHHALYLSLEPASRGAYLALLKFRASLDVRHVAGRCKPLREMWQAPVPADSLRSFCDVGAFDGDTLIAMKAAFPKLERSFTVEPNPDLIASIGRAAEAQGLINHNFTGVAWNRRTKVDAERLFNEIYFIREADAGEIQAERLDVMTGGEAYDYIKLDVEGTETQALQGGQALIRQAHCVAVAAYHVPGDLLDIPALMRRLLAGQDWRCAFEHYSQSYDDSVFYFFRP